MRRYLISFHFIWKKNLLQSDYPTRRAIRSVVYLDHRSHQFLAVRADAVVAMLLLPLPTTFCNTLILLISAENDEK